MIARRGRFSAACVLALAGLSAEARAEGSGGSGGPIGAITDFPCAGCLFDTPPGYDPALPTPFLVTFHGDEGDPQYIHNSFDDHTRAAGFILLSLQCPYDLNCGAEQGSWWNWQSTPDHDPSWVGRQVDQIEAQYNVDRQRMYLAGFSGGASYLDRYGLDNTDRFAGMVFLGGGFPPWDGQCFASCTIPTYFLIGSLDYLLDGAQGLRDYLTSCGHEVVYEERPGIEHTIIRDGLPTVLQFFADRPHMCRVDPDPPPPMMMPPDEPMPPPDDLPMSPSEPIPSMMDPSLPENPMPGAPSEEPGVTVGGLGCTTYPDCDACTSQIDECVCSGASFADCEAHYSSAEDDGGCGCRAVGEPPSRGQNALIVAALGMLMAGLRRRRSR